jgi:hypothetical protein
VVERRASPLGAHQSSFRKDSGFQIVPERDEQLPRERHDPDLPHATVAFPKLPLVPPRQRAPRLKAQPRSRGLNRERADPPVPRFRDPLLVLEIATLVVRVGQAGETTDLATIPELAPGEEFHHVQPGAVDAHAAELVELPDPSNRRIVRRLQQGAALLLKGADALRVAEHRLPLALEATTQERRERAAIPQPGGLHVRRQLPNPRQRDP